MLTKIIAPGAQSFDEPRAQLVKVSSRGLRGNDLGALIKRAGYPMADALRQIKLGAGDVPIHLIALGDTEHYGPNRNGDGFPEAACRRYHDTFTKHARAYRNHDNKRPDQSYGVVKYSAYNDAMHRIELLVALNGTKEAAARNGGLVADKEMEQLTKNADDYGVSMACRVPYDVCSGCGNKARTRAEYCTADTCPYGGLRHNITKVAEDGHHLHAENHDPDFFDISKVWRPADRIAFVLGRIEKAAAADGRPMDGAELAEAAGVTCPFGMWADEQPDARVRRRMKLAADLALLEGVILQTKYAGAWSPAVQPPLPPPPASSPAGLGQAYRALADDSSLLPVRDFLRFACGVPMPKAAAVAAGVSALLPGVFGRMIEDPEGLALSLRPAGYDAANTADHDTRAWARKAAEDCSLCPSRVQRRAWLAAIRTKEAAAPAAAPPKAELQKYAGEYALYQLAALDAMSGDPHFALTVDMMIRNNRDS